MKCSLKHVLLEPNLMQKSTHTAMQSSELPQMVPAVQAAPSRNSGRLGSQRQAPFRAGEASAQVCV